MKQKTKILLAILGTIFTVILVLSVVSLGQLLRQRIQLSYANHNVIAHEILYDVRHSLETGLRGRQLNPRSPDQLREMVADTLRSDEDVQSVLKSVIRYSPTVYDISVVDWNNRVLSSTDATTLDQYLGIRPDFATLVHGSFYQQVMAVFGPPQVLDVSVPLDRNGQPFVVVRVGIRSTFLKNEILPSLHNAMVLILLLAGVSLVISALLANLALRPLALISERLDRLTRSQPDQPPEGEPAEKGDEVAVVSTKIERLGERMRNVQEVFTALKENLDQVLGNLQDGLVLFTHDGRAVLVSTSAARFLGVDRDRILGSRMQDVLDRSTALGRTICDALDARIVLLQEEVQTESGRRIQVSLDQIHDEKSTASSLGALLTLHDAESVQAIADDLEISRRMAAIGRLTAGVGHEVKNPINAIVVHVELLRNKMAQAPGEAHRHLEIIHGEVQRLNRVVQMLVDFSQPVEIRTTDLDLRSLVADVAELQQQSLEGHGIALQTELCNYPLPVQVDADLIKQCLLNLVQNASHAMPQGGTLTLSAARKGREAAITVRDTGVGIPPEQLDKVFNLYYTTKATGSGIGLAMCYRILQLHNGSVIVESSPGNGTAFTLFLPMTSLDQSPRHSPLVEQLPPGELDSRSL